MPVPVASNRLPILAGEINAAHAAVKLHTTATIEEAMNAGDRLREAKELVGHGGWLPWLREHCPHVSERTAHNYMRQAKCRSQIESRIRSAADFSQRDALELCAEVARDEARVRENRLQLKAERERRANEEAYRKQVAECEAREILTPAQIQRLRDWSPFEVLTPQQIQRLYNWYPREEGERRKKLVDGILESIITARAELDPAEACVLIADIEEGLRAIKFQVYADLGRGHTDPAEGALIRQ
jgi:Protein of unknown function (DUF3102)